jgi:hypothetical protein
MAIITVWNKRLAGWQSEVNNTLTVQERGSESAAPMKENESQTLNIVQRFFEKHSN